MLGIALRFRTVPVTAQIRTNDCESFGEFRRNAMPADVSLRITVQQQNRITVASAHEVNSGLLSFYLLTSETLKHKNIYTGVLRTPTKESLERQS
jgi:hypothetical protein